ncbi:MAG: hypothetical protein WA885_18145 [Phormidesmis sp.]
MTVYSPLRIICKAFVFNALSSVTMGFVLLGGVFFNPSGSSARAQQVSPQLRQTFLSDPLTAKDRDPLLPVLPLQRPLSPLELSALDQALDQLDQTAQQLLAAGQKDDAFALWLREVRLRRVFGPVEEFNEIQRLALLAWNQQRPIEVQLLTLRTREIWAAVKMSLGLDTAAEFAEKPVEEDAPALRLPEQTVSAVALLEAIAQTFTTLRDIESAVEVSQQLIDLTKADGGNPTAQQVNLAELHLDWFRFAQAADVYLDLLKTARAAQAQPQEVFYLERLVYSYQEADSLANAVRAQTDLLTLYQAQGEAEKLPELLVALAQNYQTLNLPKPAIEYYRSAYSAAQRFEQFSFSAQVLKDLGALYQSLALFDDALGAYTLLIPVEQQAYNNYGVMNAYDAIGQIHKRQGNDFEALKAFEQALVIANQLNLRENYFIEQIESVT